MQAQAKGKHLCEKTKVPSFFMYWQQTFFYFPAKCSIICLLLCWYGERGLLLSPTIQSLFILPRQRQKWGVLYVGRAMMCLWIEIKGN